MNEADSLRSLHRQLSNDDSASFSVWYKKLRRIAEGNVRTENSAARNLGITIERPRKRKIPGIPNFVAYDGEGWSDKYVLLANSFEERISNPEGLSTLDCLEFLSQKYSVQVTRVFFSFGYDVNHILRDVDDATLNVLLSGKTVEWEGYRLQYVPSKLFVINNIKYYDVFSFFQKSFVKVVSDMLGEERVTGKLIEGKEARGQFETWDFQQLVEYNDEELRLLVELLDKLATAFWEIGVYLREWYGPGAVAKYWFKQYGIELNETYTAEVLHALSSAYYGGRFEQIQLGTISPVYEYDIHSAYPAAMVDMPYFNKWTKARQYRNDPYSIWHVSFDLREDARDTGYTGFLPLPMRTRDGRICFPLVGKGWYWNSEIQNVLKYHPRSKITFHGGYVASVSGLPFRWIGELYDYRRRLKAEGNLSQYCIKVGLNSLYGKTAQRVGRNRYFSLAWAGYITSTTRAKLADAGYQKPDSIIGFATDALFSTIPLELPSSDALGDWGSEVFDRGTFIQSGVYRLYEANGKVHDRYRGAPLRRGIDDIISQLTNEPTQNPKVRIGRFISHLLALRAPAAYQQFRLQFTQISHTLAIDAPYKRHYLDFMVNAEGDKDFGRLLSQPIRSLPKIWVNDDNVFLWNEYLYDNLPFQNVESYPPPVKDALLQRLMEEGMVIAAEDGNIVDIADLADLPIVREDAGLN